MVRIVHGANTQELQVEGKTVAEVKQELRDVLNISDESKAIISGDNVENGYVLQEGDVLEFVKPAGRKG